MLARAMQGEVRVNMRQDTGATFALIANNAVTHAATPNGGNLRRCRAPGTLAARARWTSSKKSRLGSRRSHSRNKFQMNR
jgi:hypothetical protein